MASRGVKETELLRENIEKQVDRLISQLADLETCKDELSPEEYEETRQETMEQFKELKASLQKMMSGNMTLIDEMNSVQLAIQAAISNAFKTPEVIRMFSKRQPGQLRLRLADLERECKCGHITSDAYSQQKVEILEALRRLGEDLSPAESEFLREKSTLSLGQFEEFSPEKGIGEKVLNIAGEGVSTAL
ncbi:unnamed protein product [Darwinula stevensoni]|uniref:Beta-catenin-interacting ICAT domain-containing protein n=1 Tax=Darwinula stevensoni TaxID=69355 RepID=A0A7R9FQI4_9CRUS|nr:unnamed protein product [Darwinula stevensoni]CAG0899226.1 unnamed protein product [Darwinula stevensoni]